MIRVLAAFFAAIFIFSSAPMTHAQEPYWVQIESNPTLTGAEAAIRRYTNSVKNVVGFRLASGWYAVAAGPYTQQGATNELRRLKSLGLLPRDAYVESNNRYGAQFWPVGDNALARYGTDGRAAAPQNTPAGPPRIVTGPVVEMPQDDAAPEAVTPAPVSQAPRDETRAQALQSERLLNRASREALQIALQWYGLYRSGIDGAFGRGTRNSMAAWQTQQGYEATGVLTTRQRAALMANYQAELDSVGLAVQRNEDAGLELQLPMARVALGRVEAPFVHYDNIDGSGTRVLLISQRGNRTTLRALYDVLQTLEIVPLDGARARRSNDFTITGQNDKIHSHSYARLQDGMVKGFIMTWDPSEAELMTKIADIMQASLRSTGRRTLPETAGQEDAPRIDLLAGLVIRQPVRSRSGFYIDASGTVLTTLEAIDQCSRITLSDLYEADVVGQNTAAGVAVLRARMALAPLSYARFLSNPPRMRADVAVAGFSFQGALGAPTLSFGTVQDLRGLSDEPELVRLDVQVRDGDTGGPVFDASGAVIGMLMPHKDVDKTRLPEGVNFALNGAALSRALGRIGINTQTTPGRDPIDPVDLTRNAAYTTTLISCWQ